jgi:ATP-dependent helicase/nuclease subunit B
MNSIAKIDFPASHTGPLPLAHPAVALWADPVSGLLARIQSALAQRGAHPARCVVLLPYAQLRPLAARLWAQCVPDGFAPPFETTQNWSTSVGGFRPGDTDIAFDLALDTLTAQALLRGAGLAEQQEVLTGQLVQAAHQLGPLAAACLPAERANWAQRARLSAMLGMEGPTLALEAAVARIAVEWAAQSAYASDLLFDPDVRAQVDCLVPVSGFAVDPMLPALQAFWGDRLAALSLTGTADEGLPAPAPALTTEDEAIAWHPCDDSEDEAQRTAACVVRHIAAGRFPVALVSTDRALTRRVRAMLECADVQIRDETGWKLSTSHAGAHLMALLKAAVWNASSDAVLAWLKGAPAFAQPLNAMEAAIRRDQARDWRSAAFGPAFKKLPSGAKDYAAVQTVRETLQGNRTLAGWLVTLRAALQASGAWDGLQQDGAGAQMLSVLRLEWPAPPAWEQLLTQALWSARRMDLAEFTSWVNQALEGASFSPPYPLHEEVVILPMSQMLARPFAALVMAGCDEVRLNPSPEPPGGWTAAQRAALGLPTREDLQQVAVAAWQHALMTPHCDVLWRCSDDTGETLLPSALVQQMQAAQAARGDHGAPIGLGVLDGQGSGPGGAAADPRIGRLITPEPAAPPQPLGALLPVTQLSASAYDDLRQCPYRFFAMRQLGLQPVDELDATVDKRDFGLWLHAVLSQFHEALAALDHPDQADRTHMLDAAADATTESMGLGEGEFLPFTAAWPAGRDGYVRWLAQHEATGAVFATAETAYRQPLGPVTLIGRIDRTDRLADGTTLVLDYKTENAAKTSARIKEPFEDTQIAFYAALLPHDTVAAAYVNVGERGERDATKTYTQTEVVAARDALIDGILHDMDAIAQGTPLPALGDGAACDFCQARGLCRKDFWV